MTKRVILGEKQAYSQAGIRVPGPIPGFLGEIGAFWTTFAPFLLTFAHFYADLDHFCSLLLTFARFQTSQSPLLPAFARFQASRGPTRARFQAPQASRGPTRARFQASQTSGGFPETVADHRHLVHRPSDYPACQTACSQPATKPATKEVPRCSSQGAGRAGATGACSDGHCCTWVPGSGRAPGAGGGVPGVYYPGPVLATLPYSALYTSPTLPCPALPCLYTRG